MASIRSSHTKCNHGFGAILWIHRANAAQVGDAQFSTFLATLARMVGGCMLVCSANGGESMQGKHEEQP